MNGVRKVLVLCTGNSCRSQMAEGYLRFFGGDKIEVYSAGIEAHGVNPRAIASMLEDGIDISQHSSNKVSEYENIDFDFVITVCDNAYEHCPFFPSTAFKIHRNFPDPANVSGSEEVVKDQFRLVRKLIKEFSKQFVEDSL